MKRFACVILTTFVAASAIRGQSPAPVVVQAVAPAQPAAASGAVPPASGAAAAASALKFLQEVKAANDEVLKRQSATLQQLDELEKSAAQIKVYTKRG